MTAAERDPAYGRLDREEPPPKTGSHLRLEDGTTWPDPADPGDVAWQLRYGTPTREQMVMAASVMAAYARLGLGPGSRQLPALRRAARAAQVARGDRDE